MYKHRIVKHELSALFHNNVSSDYLRCVTADQKFMLRAIDLAKRGLGHVGTNPPVGAVIVYKDRIIGEGYHKRYGGPHAEVAAVNSVSEKNRPLLPESTIYVTLEPCSFHGKTPPCVDLLLRERFKRVVIGSQDPHPKVSGKSIALLRKSGVDVELDVLKDEAYSIAQAFITAHFERRPRYVLKWAQTHSGWMGNTSHPVQISNKQTQLLSHKWRSQIPAILIGVGTAIIDQPQLTDRYHGGPFPKPIVIDPKNVLSENHPLRNRTKLIHITEETLEPYSSDQRQSLLERMDALLLEQGVNEVLVEGGRNTLQRFIDQKHWDEARVFRAEDPKLPLDVKAPILHRAKRSSRIQIGDNFYDIFHPEQ